MSILRYVWEGKFDIEKKVRNETRLKFCKVNGRPQSLNESYISFKNNNTKNQKCTF
jgi:hypothetical protein